ncbi:hypothetical protein V1477_006068 [Vespula maculifrons]|uniref:Uncharacterized protein n=1 Tax=Vespula maculifrons TaxID=7453 RepID=A0ABD2CKP6_VESMC
MHCTRQHINRLTSTTAIDYEANISTIYGITLADMSKSIIWRRSRREGEEKKAGTCAHVRGIEFGRERRRGIGKVTRARSVATLDQNGGTKIELDFSILKGGNPHRSPHLRAQLIGPTRKKLE